MFPVPRFSIHSEEVIRFSGAQYMSKSVFSVLLVLVLGCGHAVADLVYTPISLGDVANGRLQFRHPEYPTGPDVLLGGVPFDIPTTDRNTWFSAQAASGGSGTVSVTLPVGLRGVTGVHTLINTLWGTASTPALATLRFTFDDGSIFVKPLVGNVDIRDYYQNVYTNEINNTTTVRVFFTDTDGPAGPNRYRLDKQFVDLSAFSEKTLVSVRLADFGNENLQRTFLAGMTVQSVPEPSALLLLGSGVLGLFAGRRARGR